MIKIEKTEVFGWEAAIRGMRNPMNSWDRMDSYYDAQGNITKGENYLQYYEQFSKIPITKYEFTEENVLKYLQSNNLIIPETPST